MALHELRMKLPAGDIGRLINSYIFPYHPDTVKLQRNYRIEIAKQREPHPLHFAYTLQILDGIRHMQYILDPIFMRNNEFDEYIETVNHKRVAYYRECRRYANKKMLKQEWESNSTEIYWKNRLKQLRDESVKRIYNSQKLLAYLQGEISFLVELNNIQENMLTL